MEPERRPWRWPWIVLLSSGVVVGFGSLFYAFSVLLTDEAAGSDFSTTALSIAYGGTVLVAGGIAYPVGRIADRIGVTPIVVTGGLVGAAGLTVLSVAGRPWQVVAAGVLLIGPAGGMTFYEPAFAAVDQWFSPAHRPRALAVLTVIGGLAGVIFIPVTSALVEWFTWRPAARWLAAGMAGSALIQAAGLPRIRPLARGRRPDRVPIGALLRDRRLVLFTAGLLLTFGSFQAVFFHRLAVFEEAGSTVGLVAAWAAGSSLLSFPGRSAGPFLARRVGTLRLNALSLAGLGMAVLPMALHPRGWGMPAHFIGFGIVFGLLLPLRALVMGEWYGGPGYATVMGAQWSLTALAGAAGPMLVGVFRDLSGAYRGPMLVVAAAMGIAAIFTLAAGRR
jgi:MFS family permease